MPRFIPKSKKDDEKNLQEPLEKKPQAAPEPTEDELDKLKELERKFGKLEGTEARKEPSKEPEKKSTPSSGGSVWEKLEKSKTPSDSEKGHEKIVQHDAQRHTRIPEGMIGPGSPEYISQETVEKRKRELAMTDAKLRSIEREEQDLNKRLEYLRREHSAMELAIKEKTHLEREIAELREDRDRVKAKLDELKELEGQLEQKTWDELKRTSTMGAKISALERRIHELEGQILELNEQRLRAGVAPVTQPQPKKEEPKPEPKPEVSEAKEEKPAPKPEPETTKPSPQPVKQAEKKPSPQKEKKTRLTF